jgi:quinone-modifying oxidoreductase subunit QmoB
MDKKIGVYICGGCGIAEAVDTGKLVDVANKDYKVAALVHPFLCSPEGVEQVRKDIAETGINGLVIAACSPRAKTEVFSFDPETTVSDRVNLREQVAWSHAPKPADGKKFDEDIQMLAEDQLRMGIVRTQNMDPPEPYLTDFSKAILVVGGGVTGMTSALEAARAGYEIVLVEKEPALGGFATKLFKEYPKVPPYRDPVSPDIRSLIEALGKESRVKVFASATIEKISGAPGMFDAFIRQNGSVTTERVGAVVLATGFEPYDATKLGHLGFGESPNVVTSLTVEEMAAKGNFARPSDGKAINSAAFILCAGSRDANHLPYCSTTCCMTSLKQAMYLREQNPEAKVYIFYKDIRTPGQYENFYRRAQEDEGIFMTKGQVAAVAPEADGSVSVEVDDTLLGEKIRVRADLVVLATGMVPRTALGEEEVQVISEEDAKQKKDKQEDMASRLLIPTKMIKSNTLNLAYRQGPELPDLKYGFPDSHFICFPYETRRTGMYAAGPVRQPMDIAFSKEDARGAALKAIQCVELTSEGKSMHPRVGDMSYPDLFMQRCTQCKRCTEECPFGMYNEDEKGNPLPNPTRCRRCSICMGSCPERIISFKDYSVPMIGAMIKAIEVPEEDEEKPRILILACENDAYPALDMVGWRRATYNPFVRIISLRCLGSLNLIWIADTLSKGIDGILLLGCVHGQDYQCHMIKGSELANYRLSKVQETLTRLALESKRLRIEQIEISDYNRLPGIIDEFLETINEVGPNPYKGF